MAGVVAFSVADSAFAYMAELNNYNAVSALDTGWVAGYLLIGLGALWAMTSPVPEVSMSLDSTVSIVAPYVPVLVVLAVTAFELVKGRHLGTVSWLMAFALAGLVILERRREHARRSLLERWRFSRRRGPRAKPRCGNGPLDSVNCHVHLHTRKAGERSRIRLVETRGHRPKRKRSGGPPSSTRSA